MIIKYCPSLQVIKSRNNNQSHNNAIFSKIKFKYMENEV